MNLDKLTIGELKEIQKLLGGVQEEHPFEVGENYFIRTVTMHLLGKLVSVYPTELVLEEASWVAEDGRFHDFITKGGDDNVEIEPFSLSKQVVVGRGAIIDATIWEHNLPRKQK